MLNENRKKTISANYIQNTQINCKKTWLSGR